MRWSPFRDGTVLNEQILALLPRFKNSYLKAVIKSTPSSWVALIVSLVIKPYSQKVTPVIRIFVLNYARFRDDLEALDRYTDIEFLVIPNWTQRWITAIDNDPLSRQAKSQSRCSQQFLGNFLNALCAKRAAAGFISCGIYYAQNLSWEIACSSYSIPFFCLHREFIGAEPDTLNRLVSKHIPNWKRFHGDVIMLATAASKDMLTKHRYVEQNKIVVTGAPRFDIVQHEVVAKKERAKLETKKMVVLFSFVPVTGQPDLRMLEGTFPDSGGFQNLFFAVHECVTKFAVENPDVRVVIKPKWYRSHWKDAIDKSVISVTGNLEARPSNLEIVDDIPALQLIAEAGLVISLNSTTGFEALMCSIPSILPHFEEAAGSLREALWLKDSVEPFWVANSRSDLECLLRTYKSGGLHAKKVPAGYFDNIIGPTDGKASTRVRDHILAKIDDLKRLNPSLVTPQNHK
jgi:hypothetical protein